MCMLSRLFSVKLRAQGCPMYNNSEEGRGCCLLVNQRIATKTHCRVATMLSWLFDPRNFFKKCFRFDFRSPIFTFVSLSFAQTHMMRVETCSDNII